MLKPSLPARILASCLLAATGCCLAAGTTTFTVGVEDYPNFLPYSSYQNGQYRGLGKDILDAFAREHGYTFHYRVFPLKRRDMLFVEGKLDFSFPDNPNWVTDLKKNAAISYVPMLPFTDGVLVRPEHVGKGLAHLKVLGVPLGFTPYPYQQLINNGALQVEEVTQYDALYQKLLTRHVDGTYMNTRIARYYWSRIRKTAKEPVVYDPALPHATGFWYLSTTRHTDVIEAFKQFLVSHRKEIDALKLQYGFRTQGE
ncbi:ABC transporter substrate-binding protein [Vogesella sp. LIG4]|uniref:substrate-binding periplasmic protein n=1 Tax=Vogesella sp. LIG4 TaxID=1192162 RepID=UPI0012FE72F2|nr:transporter substrate-binding domain-containing protein [Vogesella sp. LIG4]